MRYLLLVLLAVSLSCSASWAELYLYDNFNGDSIDTDLWTVDVGGEYINITEENGHADLNMLNNVSGKYCRLKFKDPVQLADSSESVRVTWDMELSNAGYSTVQSYHNGLSVGASSTEYIEAGQMGNNPSFLYEFVLRNKTEAQWDGVNHGIEVYFHYDLTYSSTSQTLNVYTYNAAWDSAPEMYETDTPLWTQATGYTLPTSTDLDALFFVELNYGADGSAVRRSRMYLDNVYTSMPVPEPASLLMVTITGACVSIRKRRMR